MTLTDTKFTAYKLFRKRADGTLGPLCVNRGLVIPKGVWLRCEFDCDPRNASYRPGWHARPRPFSDHVQTLPNRVWCLVYLDDAEKVFKSKYEWWHVAKWMKVIREVRNA